MNLKRKNLTVSGGFGQFAFNTDGKDNVFSIDKCGSLNFFESFSVKKPVMAQNKAGVYTFINLDRNPNATLIGFKRPKHLLRKRLNGCQWIPKGKLKMDLKEITTTPIEYQGQQCPDAFYGHCLEKIFGTGNEIRDFYATEEGRKLVDQFIGAIYDGLGNDFWMLAHFGDHPLIMQSDINEWWKTTNEEDADSWADFKDQMEATGGFITAADALKAKGWENMNCQIFNNEVNGSFKLNIV